MELKKEATIVILVILFLFFIGFFNTNKIITGRASTLGNIENPMMENEYLLYVNEAKWIEGNRVELLDVSENNDAIIKVNNEIRSISDAIIVSNDLQIQKNVAIKETNKKSFAVLNIIKVEQGEKIECKETDDNIYLKGTCYDNYYKMGIEDFCDNEYLKEYSCEYDEYVNKVHCMKETVKCEKGCSNGACISRIVAY